MGNIGKLYLVATPIGNLDDITYRAVKVLNEVDLIAAEDTRHSLKLLNHLNISKPLISYHRHNEDNKTEVLINKILNGENIAIITDAGTPAISDPGEVLVAKCLEAGIHVTSLPGCCALITALTLSGLPTRRFCFEGFLPADKKEKKFILEELKGETRTIILYEAPHHLVKTLEELKEALGNRRITLCRELTKKFETVFPTTLEGALAYYSENEPKGEYVLVLEGISRQQQLHDKQEEWERLTIQEHMQIYTEQGLNRKEAMKKVAVDRGIGKRDVYQSLLEDEDQLRNH